MGKENFSKIKLLKIWDILRRYSDEDQPLTTKQIIDMLAEEGIACNRKTIYQDMEVLNDYGYEVLCKKGQSYNSYYVCDRIFDVPELKILIDAVQAASFISPKKSNDLIDKISSLGGNYRAELLKSSMSEFNVTKHTNESVYYNIDSIEKAILDGKKLHFQYFDIDEYKHRILRKNGEIYIVNPISMVLSNDNYYMICYHDNHNDITKYRIDRMLDVKVSKENINVDKKPKSLNIAEHRKQAFYMFGGKIEKVKFEADRSLINVIYDKFGENTKISQKSNNKIMFEVEVQISSMFFGWCLSFGEKLAIIGPNKIINQLSDYIGELSLQYPNKNS